jgi:hypothetical protein
MAAQDAVLAAEEAERRAANAVHDGVLSVLRAVIVAGRQVPWSQVMSKARRAKNAGPAGAPRRPRPGRPAALRCVARSSPRPSWTYDATWTFR